MAKTKVTKKEVDKMMKIEDRTRGMLLKSMGDYIVTKKGEKTLKMIEKRLKELGYPINFKDAASYTWYEGPYDTLLTLVTLEAFGWDESKAFDIGYDSLVIHSLAAKLFMTRFVSLELAFKNASKFWFFFSHTGTIKFTDYDVKKKYAILRLDDYKKFHMVEYNYMRGALTRILEMMANSKDVKIKQTKCLFWDDTYDEFKLTWK